jgi:FkbM family methyltransferase
LNLSGISNENLLGKLVRQPLRLIPDQARMPILQGKLRGKRWIAGAHTHGCWLGTYEIEKQKLFTQTVESGATVYDIGANVGFYTLLSSVIVGLQGHVYAFEPLPRNVCFLREHIRLNGIANATVVEAAVSDRSGETDFDDSTGSATGHIKPSGGLRVKMVKLDEFIADNSLPSPDCMKIDVEGDEMLVLTGAKSLLSGRQPTLFLSTHGADVHRDCCALLSSLGYSLQPVTGMDINETDELIATGNRSPLKTN